MTAFAHDQENTAPMCVLFLCTHNSSRSQMAEGLLQTRGGTRTRSLARGHTRAPCIRWRSRPWLNWVSISASKLDTGPRGLRSSRRATDGPGRDGV